ncbi:hypothetical protein LNP05_29560 [Klebsiella pneumoniae subsp. pneumoniae]|nr:hypothetical protein [Klebsiella pneumoniae subsp. pneumoniae]
MLFSASARETAIASHFHRYVCHLPHCTGRRAGINWLHTLSLHFPHCLNRSGERKEGDFVADQSASCHRDWHLAAQLINPMKFAEPVGPRKRPQQDGCRAASAEQADGRRAGCWRREELVPAPAFLVTEMFFVPNARRAGTAPEAGSASAPRAALGATVLPNYARQNITGPRTLRWKSQ